MESLEKSSIAEGESGRETLYIPLLLLPVVLLQLVVNDCHTWF
jgi:hypothetical protein